MTRKLAGLGIAMAALCLTPALAQDKKPDMTPEQQAEMEAYMKAGSPGEPHKALAEGVGTYDTKVKMWQSRAPPRRRPAPPPAR